MRVQLTVTVEVDREEWAAYHALPDASPTAVARDIYSRTRAQLLADPIVGYGIASVSVAPAGDGPTPDARRLLGMDPDDGSPTGHAAPR